MRSQLKLSLNSEPLEDIDETRIPSILKWSGSKRAQAQKIAEHFPSHARYFEPFLGGGALLYKFATPGSMGSDVYSPLIDFWKLVRDNPEHLIKNYKKQWEALQKSLPEYYYTVRERFNKNPNPEDLNFLMRTCVNGIVRFSKEGKFNNSFHLSRRGMTPKNFEQIVDAWSIRLTGVHFEACDYSETLARANKQDFVYLDPPYVGSKNRYIGDLDAEKLYRELDILNSRGIRWALSFDGSRGNVEYQSGIPSELYKRMVPMDNGHSAVSKVLNGPIETVIESLYLNY